MTLYEWVLVRKQYALAALALAWLGVCLHYGYAPTSLRQVIFSGEWWMLSVITFGFGAMVLFSICKTYLDEGAGLQTFVTGLLAVVCVLMMLGSAGAAVHQHNKDQKMLAEAGMHAPKLSASLTPEEQGEVNERMLLDHFRKLDQGN